MCEKRKLGAARWIGRRLKRIPGVTAWMTAVGVAASFALTACGNVPNIDGVPMSFGDRMLYETSNHAVKPDINMRPVYVAPGTRPDEQTKQIIRYQCDQYADQETARERAAVSTKDLAQGLTGTTYMYDPAQHMDYYNHRGLAKSECLRQRGLPFGENRAPVTGARRA